jgi:hypothetical protein
LEIHGNRIRLWGIDAPESTQLCRGDDSDQNRCGAQAANDLDARRPANCNPINLDRYGRMVAKCSFGGADLGECRNVCASAVDAARANAKIPACDFCFKLSPYRHRCFRRDAQPRAPIDCLPSAYLERSDKMLFRLTK